MSSKCHLNVIYIETSSYQWCIIILKSFWSYGYPDGVMISHQPSSDLAQSFPLLSPALHVGQRWAQRGFRGELCEPHRVPRNSKYQQVHKNANKKQTSLRIEEIDSVLWATHQHIVCNAFWGSKSSLPRPTKKRKSRKGGKVLEVRTPCKLCMLGNWIGNLRFVWGSNLMICHSCTVTFRT